MHGRLHALLALLVLLAAGADARAAGTRCASSADCPKGELCDGLEGCGATWRCVAGRLCTQDLVRYCGCDGKTFSSSSGCPGRPYAARGACRPTPAPKACTRSADCAKGQDCAGPEGCGAAWSCQPARACTRDRVPYCGCDGKTFSDSSTCPRARYAARGACEAPRGCTESSQCPKGTTCQGPEGCAASWSCQPARICTQNMVPFCGCTGETFRGSSSCPPRPFAHRGACGPGGGGGRARTCSSSAQCDAGEMCQGPPGCNVPWTCVPARNCTRDLVQYCGCDGKTFQGSSNCPSRPYASRGRCEAVGRSTRCSSR